MNVDHRILIVGGAAIFSLLVSFIILFIFLYQKRHHKYIIEKQRLESAFQKEIFKTQLETQENTFHQIAEDLHDNIGQLLSTTRMLLGTVERSIDPPPDTLITANHTLAKAIQDLRMLTKSLNKEWLSQFNIVDSLKAEAERINAAQLAYVQIISGQDSIPLDSESSVMLFRIIQEALHNSIKHSAATRIIINIEQQEEVRVQINDNGKGFNVDELGLKGIGLLNMQHRTALLGGNIEWQSADGEGTRITINIPLNR